MSVKIEKVTLGDGSVYSETHYENGNKTYYCTRRRTGEIRSETFYNSNGEVHRDDDEPAFIEYYEGGNIFVESFYKNGKNHREENKAAYSEYEKNGIPLKQLYFENGKRIK